VKQKLRAKQSPHASTQVQFPNRSPANLYSMTTIQTGRHAVIRGRDLPEYPKMHPVSDPKPFGSRLQLNSELSVTKDPQMCLLLPAPPTGEGIQQPVIRSWYYQVGKRDIVRCLFDGRASMRPFFRCWPESPPPVPGDSKSSPGRCAQIRRA